MTIGIDLDDTVVETSNNANEYLKKYDINFKDDYHKHPKYEEFLALYRRDIIKSSPLIENVKEAFEFLNQNGYKIVIITYRPDNYVSDVNEITIQYLKKHGLKYDKFINTYYKGQAALENGVDLFIDDKEKHLDDVYSYGIECICYGERNDSKYRTFSNWKDIIEYIKNRKG